MNYGIKTNLYKPENKENFDKNFNISNYLNQKNLDIHQMFNID